MFTGLIAALGTVERLAEGSTSCRLTVRAPRLLSGVKIGDSIAVNGVCLTVVHLRGDTFTADVMPETVRRTTLHLLQPGDRVNLEKALRPVDGLDGHIVQGHVEGVGVIQQIVPEGNARVYRIKAPGELLRYIVEKGSIAIDGISLTVTEADDSGFGVSLIPHTAKMTTLGYKTRWVIKAPAMPSIWKQIFWPGMWRKCWEWIKRGRDLPAGINRVLLRTQIQNRN